MNYLHACVDGMDGEGRGWGSDMWFIGCFLLMFPRVWGESCVDCLMVGRHFWILVTIASGLID